MQQNFNSSSKQMLELLWACAGLLPTFATIPIFWGLYRTLTNVTNAGLLDGGFYWIPSLSGPVSPAGALAGVAVTHTHSALVWQGSFALVNAYRTCCASSWHPCLMLPLSSWASSKRQESEIFRCCSQKATGCGPWWMASRASAGTRPRATWSSLCC